MGVEIHVVIVIGIIVVDGTIVVIMDVAGTTGAAIADAIITVDAITIADVTVVAEATMNYYGFYFYLEEDVKIIRKALGYPRAFSIHLTNVFTIKNTKL
ncbi:hypothetical protein [Clostridium frigidicarnis]|uniref:Uncharacterized protein n=1 Tax=Clostridium frigidicarnis TaxID=84698 RepID=A0A1I0V5H3_9CLOT|nr:hypothetical protein [Clostridium frigidicarnis]SFA71320.1 hypothetical protein SAMN04488528_1001156 [Clostridium frigidicarnis]